MSTSSTPTNAEATSPTTTTATTRTLAAACDSHVDLFEFRGRLEEMAEKIQAWQPQIQLERAFVKETILRAYEFQRSVDILKELVKEERVLSDPILSKMFQAEIDTREPVTKAILELPPSLLTFFEVNLIKLVKYQLEHKEKEINYLPVPDKEFCKWISDQRMRINKFLEKKKASCGPALHIIQQDIQLFERLNVKFRVTTPPKTYEDWVLELREFKSKNGHLKVRQKLEDKKSPNPLGEWVKKIRREYVHMQADPDSKVPNLTPERIAELDDMGMIWQIRHGRPKKGDARYRLRRSSTTRYGHVQVSYDGNPNNNDNNSGSGNDENDYERQLDRERDYGDQGNNNNMYDDDNNNNNFNDDDERYY
jgi:adenylate kinase family enzyme